MRYRLTFIAGFGAGYLLGAKAGRKRYDTITDGVRRLIDSPAVQETAGVLQAQASGAFATAKSSVTAKVGDSVGARFGGGPDDHHHDSTSPIPTPMPAPAPAAGTDPDSPPPYPQAGHQELGAES